MKCLKRGLVERGSLARLAAWGGVLLCLAPAHAENWPQFRGSEGTGVARTTSPAEWSATQNIAWKVAVPGAAWSQPIIWGDKVFLTTAVTENQRKPSVGGGGGRGGFGGFGGGFAPRPGGAPSGERPASDRPEGERPAAPPGAPRPGFGGPGRPGGFGGRGGSAPDAVYQWKVLCLDRNSGKTLWEQQVKEAKPTIPTHSTNTFASETPVTDGERLYCYFGMTGLYCLDLNGKELWNKNLGSYPMSNGWGTGSSPVLVDDKLLILCDNEQQSFLAALDKKTGSELWRVSRDERSNWGTPFLWKNKTRTEVVVSGATTRSYDPASGKVLWSLGGNRGGARSSPVANAELLYVGTGGGMGGNGPLTAIKAGASGELDDSPAAIAWTITGGGAAMASPLLYEGCLYVLDQRGGVCACYDALTGKLHYKERLPSATGFTSSPWAAGGKVFCLDQSGQTYVLEPGAEFKVLHVNKLDDTFWSSAALAETQLLLRGNNNLYCISAKQP